MKLKAQMMPLEKNRDFFSDVTFCRHLFGWDLVSVYMILSMMYKQLYWKANLSTLCTACNLSLETKNDAWCVSLLTVERTDVKCFLCFFLFGNAEVKIHLCYNAVKHGVLASFKTLLENKLELGGRWLGENGLNLYASQIFLGLCIVCAFVKNNWKCDKT